MLLLNPEWHKRKRSIAVSEWCRETIYCSLRLSWTEPPFGSPCRVLWKLERRTVGPLADPQRCCYRAWYQRIVVERCQLDEIYTNRKTGGHLPGHLRCQPRLSRTTSARQGD